MAPLGLWPIYPKIFEARKKSKEGCEQHEKGGEKADSPDKAAPRAQVIGIGWDIEHAGAEIDPSAGGCEGRGGLAERDHEYGDCEEDEAFEMVVQGASQAGRLVGHVAAWRTVASGHGVA